MEVKLCDTHTKELTEIRTEFHEYRTATNARLDEILEKIKPQFSQAQITGFLLIIMTSLASFMIYITDVKSDVRVNTVKVNNNEIFYKSIDKKLDLLITDVAILNSKNKK